MKNPEQRNNLWILRLCLTRLTGEERASLRVIASPAFVRRDEAIPPLNLKRQTRLLRRPDKSGLLAMNVKVVFPGSASFESRRLTYQHSSKHKRTARLRGVLGCSLHLRRGLRPMTVFP